MATPKARIETQTVTITSTWLSIVADARQWLEDTVNDEHNKFIASNNYIFNNYVYANVLLMA